MQYNHRPRQHQYTGNLDAEIGGYGGEDVQEAVRPRTHRDARYLRNTEEAVIAEQLANQQRIENARARKQALADVRQNHTTGNSASLRRRTSPPTNKAYRKDEEGIDGEYDDVWPPRQHTSTRRYDNIPPEGVYQVGNTRYHVEHQYTQVPPRAHAKPQLPPAPQQQTHYTQDEEEEEEELDERDTRLPPRNARRFQIHWSVFVGIALLLMLGGWIAFNDLGVWWQNHTDDVTYGIPRTYQTDAVVGHSDSNSNPSHFIALNLRGQIYVIELPGGDATKARGYFITSEVGGDPHPPVTVKFQDLTHSGHLDMVVTIGDPPNPLIVFLFNNGSQFAAKAH